MRISDWSSDVCSSDLRGEVEIRGAKLIGGRRRDRDAVALGEGGVVDGDISRVSPVHIGAGDIRSGPGADTARGDRKSVVEGKSVSVRVDLGGGRLIKKKAHIGTAYDYNPLHTL